MQAVVRTFLGVAFCVAALALPAQAERSPQIQALLEALKIAETIEIMRLEGQSYGGELATDLAPHADQVAWAGVVDQIYDTEKMYDLIAAEFENELAQTDLAPILTYYQSEDGREIVALELAARRAFLDPETEAMAVTRFGNINATGSNLLDQVEVLIQDSDLVELNVAGALNSDLMFYRGLNDGGAFALTEDEILTDVWSQENEVRRSSREWLQSFLMMAYEPLKPAQLDDYAAFYRTSEGRDLNRAIFAAFDEMYEEISYLLGLAVAGQMQSEEL